MNFMHQPTAYETIGTERLHRLGWGEVSLWAAAFFVILALQAIGAFVAVNWHTKPEIPGAPPPAIMIELSEISVAPQVEDIAADNGELALPQEPAQAVEPTPAEELTEEVVEPIEPIIEPATEFPLDTAEAVVPEPAVEPLQEPIDAIDPSEPEETIEPLAEAEPLDEVIPDLVEIEEAEVAVPMPMQMPASLQQKREQFAEAQERERQRQQQAAAAASRQTAPKSVEAEAAEQPAAAEQTTTTRRTPNISPQQWQSQVIAHLNHAKRYPSDARRRREEGIPHLQFAIDRLGRVLSARIVRSSGFPALDQAAIDMINRASPVPPPPASIPDNRITLTVPVNFNLR